MRVEFDYHSRKGVQNFRFKKNKKLTAQQIAQLRFAIEQNKKHRLRNQLVILAISLLFMALIMWGFITLFHWFESQPTDIFNPNAR